MTTTEVSPRLTVDRLVAAARRLLVQGGTEAVVVREVARALSVAPSAMYKHVSGRDELLSHLVASCFAELAERCAQARDSIPYGRPRARLAAATEALRNWAIAHPAEFALLFANPRPVSPSPADAGPDGGYARFGAAFITIFVEARDVGRLRTNPQEDLTPRLRSQLRDAGEHWGLDAANMFPVVVGLQRMLGIVSVEVTGQLGWALHDPTDYVQTQLAELADNLLTPGP